jgi:hypothetical protein
MKRSHRHSTNGERKPPGTKRGGLDVQEPAIGLFSRLLSFRNFFRDESGWIGTLELLLISSIVTFGMIVGLAAYRNALVQEYGDLSASLLHLDQSFSLDGQGFTNSIPAQATLPAGGVDVTGMAAAE